MNQIKLLEATQGKPVWVARVECWDEFGAWDEYHVYRTKRNAEEDDDFISEFCPEEFERFTGLKLNPGEYTRIRFGVSPV